MNHSFSATPPTPSRNLVARFARGMLVALVGAFLVSACATTNFPGTDIPDTEENRAIWERVMEYRKAVEGRDTDAVLAMASRSYFENGATTDESRDDYGYTELRDIVMPRFRDHVAEVQFRVLMRRIEVDGDRALADYEYYYNVRYIEGGVSAWKPRNDFNRLEFVLEDGVWRINGGL